MSYEDHEPHLAASALSPTAIHFRLQRLEETQADHTVAIAKLVDARSADRQWIETQFSAFKMDLERTRNRVELIVMVAALVWTLIATAAPLVAGFLL